MDDEKPSPDNTGNLNNSPSGGQLARTIIELESWDDMATLRQKLETVEAPTVALRVSDKAESLKDSLPLRLMKRHAEATGKQVVLISEDWTTREAAQREGFKVLYPSELQTETPVPETASGAGEGAAEKSETRRRSSVPPFWALIAGLIGLAALAYVLVPSANVIIVPKSQIVTDTLNVTARTDIQQADLELRQIPAERIVLSFETSDWLTTTGKRSVPDKPAVGKVVFINLSGRDVSVPKGTKVGTDDGIWFITDNEVIVPASSSEGQTQVNIAAVYPGEDGNVPALAISRIQDGRLRFSLRALNDLPTREGTNREVGYVTEQDRLRLRQKLTEKARITVQNELNAGLDDTQTFWPEAIEIALVQEIFDNAIGQDAEKLTLQAMAEASALIFSQADIEAAAESHLTVDEQSILLDGSLRTRIMEASAWDSDSVSFMLFAQGRLTSEFDRELIKQAIVGKGTLQAREYLLQSIPEVEDVQVSVFPEWLGILPLFGWRIDVEVQGVG